MGLVLEKGRLRLELAPEAGGSIARFDWLGEAGAVPLMRPAHAAGLAARDPLAMGSFPLVPWSGRIIGGLLATPAGTRTLALNHPGFAMPIHGLGWITPWTVAGSSAGEARLELSGGPLPTWPFAWRAHQIFRLEDATLTIEMSLTAEGPEAMPAGLGQHPYFPRTPECRVRGEIGGIWAVDRASMAPTGFAPVDPVALPFARGARIADLDLDNGFSRWRRRADILWPEHDLGLAVTASEGLAHLIIYTPPAEPYFCLEPVSQVPDAFALAARGHPDTGALALAPGETLAVTMAFRPYRLSAPNPPPSDPRGKDLA